jgi:hypothetical protein
LPTRSCDFASIIAANTFCKPTPLATKFINRKTSFVFSQKKISLRNFCSKPKLAPKIKKTTPKVSLKETVEKQQNEIQHSKNGRVAWKVLIGGLAVFLAICCIGVLGFTTSTFMIQIVICLYFILCWWKRNN